MVNRLAGYLQITPTGHPPVELKFCNGSTELFAKRMGFERMEQVYQALTCPTVDGQTRTTMYFLKALRLYIHAAALYVYRTERLPIHFTEWSASEWLDEFGRGVFLSVIDLAEKKDNEPPADPSASPLTINQFKANALSRLGLLPAAYYDLTQAETAALLDGVKDREVFALRQTRLVAVLLRNAHFTKPVSEHEFMPLPGDTLRVQRMNTPEETFWALANAFGGTVTVEDNLPQA